jgi:hypothetical protein
MDTAAGITLVNTVEKNKSKHANRDYSRAVLARKLQKVLGRSSTREYWIIVETNQLPNCPVERDDILAAEDIFSPDLGSLKSKTVRRGGEHVRPAHAHISATIMSRYRNVTVAVDIMFINKVPFLMSISRHLKFGTKKMTPSTKTPTLNQ